MVENIFIKNIISYLNVINRENNSRASFFGSKLKNPSSESKVVAISRFSKKVFFLYISVVILEGSCTSSVNLHYKKHQIFEENRSQNHMKIMSKFFQFFISCCKCIFDASEHEECMEAFLASYRLENPSNFVLYLS